MNVKPAGSNRFAANVAKLVGASVFAQGFGVIASPVITRLFAPEAFGVMALFMSISSVIGLISCFRYELAIMLPGSEKDAANLLVLSILAAVIVSACASLVFIFAGDRIAILLKSEALVEYLWLLPISIFLQGGFLAFNYWHTRSKRFGKLSFARIASSLSSNLTKLFFGFCGCVHAGVLISAFVFGQFVSFMILGINLLGRDGKRLLSSVSYDQISSNMIRYRKFPVYSTWTALLNNLSVHLATWILAVFFSPVVVGLFALCRMVITFPMQLVGTAVAQVFFQQGMAEKNQRKALSSIVASVFDSLVSLGFFPAMVLMIVGEDLFALFWGAEWADAGIYAQILCLWIFMVFISSPLSNLFNILEKQQVGLRFDILLFVTRTLSLIYGGVMGDIYLTLILYSGSGFLIWIWICFWLLGASGVSRKKIISGILKYVYVSIPLFFILFFFKYRLFMEPAPLLLLAAVECMIYYAFLIYSNESIRNQVFRIIETYGFLPSK